MRQVNMGEFYIFAARIFPVSLFGFGHTRKDSEPDFPSRALFFQPTE